MESLSRTTVLIAALLMLQVQARATAQNPVEQDYFADSPLILTASRLSKPPLESPASVSVITRQAIESSGVRLLAHPNGAGNLDEQCGKESILEELTREREKLTRSAVNDAVVEPGLSGGF